MSTSMSRPLYATAEFISVRLLSTKNVLWLQVCNAAQEHAVYGVNRPSTVLASTVRT